MNDNAVCFFDTSALIKYYHDELGRQKVVDLVDNPNNRIFISRFGLIEWHSAFFRLMRMNTFYPRRVFKRYGLDFFQIFGSKNFLFSLLSAHTKTKPFVFSPVMLPPKVCGP